MITAVMIRPKMKIIDELLSCPTWKLGHRRRKKINVIFLDQRFTFRQRAVHATSSMTLIFRLEENRGEEYNSVVAESIHSPDEPKEDSGLEKLAHKQI